MIRIIGLLFLLCTTSCVSQGRLLEPGRTDLFLSGIMAGVPVTAILCIESSLVRGGAKRITDVTPTQLQVAAKGCSDSLQDALVKEMQEEMVSPDNQKGANIPSTGKGNL